MHLYGYKVKENSEDLNGIMFENSRAFIRRMDAVVDNLWNALEGNDNNYMFRMIAMPYIPIAASDCIVAVNSDPNAPIFDVAHYCVIGDVNEIVPKLIDKIKGVS